MTEEEAKTTQCCGPEGCGYFNDQPRPARWCVASACMAWRETKAAHSAQYQPVGGSLRTVDYPAEGYCGLAGRPS